MPKIGPYVCLFTHKSKAHTHTHSLTDRAKIITPVVSLPRGVMSDLELHTQESTYDHKVESTLATVGDRYEFYT